MRGAVSYHAGRCAEDQVAQHYTRMGRPILARRWRGISGEIDVIARDGDAVIFIEVKQSNTHAAAVDHLCERQMQRICLAASEYLGGEPDGLNTSARFDVALVDAMGRIEILQNAFAA
ncbi:MAG: YraN family protein [Pseudorhodobacter sp.]|nr:YraN family protein [Pseudorhodobacter sp.]